MLKDKQLSFVEIMAKGITLSFEKKIAGFGTIVLYGNINSRVWFRKMRRTKTVLIKRELI